MLRFEKILNEDKKYYCKRSSCVIARTLTSLVIVFIATLRAETFACRNFRVSKKPAKFME